MATSLNQAIHRLDASAQKLVNFRSRPLLVMYYPPGASITEFDIGDVYKELRNAGAAKEKRLPSVDLLLQTYGGDPVAAYRIAQVIRSACDGVHILAPEHAYSAGTLMCFSGDEVRLGDFARLSPIDITIWEQRKSEGVQLAGLDSFLEFAHGARKKAEENLKELQRDGASSSIDSDLLVQMVKEIGALTVGRYYRERTLTGHYAQILLESYMFKNASDRRSRAASAIAQFLFGAPSHEFHLDYQFCKDWQLKVAEMSTEESDLGKSVVSELKNCTSAGFICQKLSPKVRMPFVRYYRQTPGSRRSHVNASSRKTRARARNTQKASGNV